MATIKVRRQVSRLTGLIGLVFSCSVFAGPPAPSTLKVPALSYDAHRVVLTWDTPEDISQIKDYQILQNGYVIATAAANNQHYSASAPYIKHFYHSNHFATPLVWQSATITGLAPKHSYQFSVRAVGKDGSVSDAGPQVLVTTPGEPTVINITKFGAKGNGETLNTTAIQAAIHACPKNCQVIIPKGVFKTGAIFLKSNMTLHLDKGAVLLGSNNPADYPDGYTLYPYSKTMRPASLINAIDPKHRAAGTFTNIRITGPGIIDGNGWQHTKSSYHDPLGYKQDHYIHSNRHRYRQDGRLAKMQVERTVKQGMSLHNAYGQMRSSLMTLRGVKNLYIGNITIRNPAYHGLMILTSNHVAVNSLRALTYDANNGDGIELGNTQNAMVFNSYFDTGDDSINFAAGTGKLAKKSLPTEDIRLFNNFFHHGHGAIVMGSHTGAGIRHVIAENSASNGTNIGLRIKSSTAIGGGVDHIIFRNMALKNVVFNALTITLKYTDPSALIDYPAATSPVQINHITMKHVSVDGLIGDPKSKHSQASLNIQGDRQHDTWYEHIALSHIRLRHVTPTYIEDLKESQFDHIKFSDIDNGKPWHLHHVKHVMVNGQAIQ